MEPKHPSKNGIPSCVSEYGIQANGSGKRSARENFIAIEAWSADSRLTTMWEGSSGLDSLRIVAMREGIRSAKETRGYGSIAMDVKDESVAPWYGCSWSVDPIFPVTTATGWAVCLRSSLS